MNGLLDGLWIRLPALLLSLGSLASCVGGGAPSPQQAVQGALNVYDADQRRQSVTLLANASFGGEEPYLRIYRLMLGSANGQPQYAGEDYLDGDATVRAAAARALGLHGSAQDARFLIPRLKDPAALPRWEAAKALQRIHAPEASPGLMDALGQDEDADVRQAAAQALGQYPQPRVFNVLVAALDDQDFNVAKAARGALKTLTGYDFGGDGSLWLIWANQQEGNLFTHGQPYTWKPFVEPRGFWDKLQFWNKPRRPAPRPPRGLTASTSPAGTGATQPR